MSRIIVFSGIDSAGKSTQIERLKKYLLSKNIKVKVIWSRGGYTPLFNLFKVNLRKVLPRSIPKPGESVNRDKTFNNKWVRTLWLNVALFDMILLYGFYYRLLKNFGYTVIADRYLWDTFIDYKLKFKNENFQLKFLWKLLEYATPVPDTSYLLTIPINESIQRSKLKNEPFSENRRQREKRYKLYLNLKEKDKWGHIIDGLKPIDRVWHEIKTKLK